MQVFDNPSALSVSFDKPNLVSAAGLLPAMVLARDAGLHELADEYLSVLTDKGANHGLKVASLGAGMVAGADSTDDMGLLRHGALKKVFEACYSPSTLGSFLRSFTFGHVRQLNAVASRFRVNLNRKAPLVGNVGEDGFVFLYMDDAIIEVHGYQKQGSATGIPGYADSTHYWPPHRPRTPSRSLPPKDYARERRTPPVAPRNCSPRHWARSSAATQVRRCCVVSTRPTTATARYRLLWPSGRTFL